MALQDPVITQSVDYQVVGSSTSSPLGAGGGGKGDYLDHLLIIPSVTNPGNVTLKDGAGAATTVFNGGSSSLSNNVPFRIDWSAYSSSGGWTVSCGTGLIVKAGGKFT